MNPLSDKDGAHWYTQLGDARYGANLREARTHDYFPSITTILQVWPTGYLNDWAAFEKVKARHNNPPEGEARKPVLPGVKLTEAQEIYFQKIRDIGNEVRDKAGKRGNEIHDGAEAILLEREWDKNDLSLQRVKHWFDDHLEGKPYWTEKNLVNLNLKVAGRADALIATKQNERPLLIDYKGRKFEHGPRKGWRAKRQATDLIQLAFYASTMVDPPRIANLYIHREGECPVEFVEYSDEERQKALVICGHVAAIWFYAKNYYPDVDHEGLLAELEVSANE